MTTLERLRNKAGMFVAIAIGVALLAFVLSDMFNSGRSVFGQNQMQIGSVGGQSIQYPEYQQKVDELLTLRQTFGGQGANNEMLTQQVREQVWQNMVHQLVLGEEFDRLGLTVTPEELSGMILGDNPHPAIVQIFTDPATGQFNREQMMTFLQNLETGVQPEQRAYWLEVERELQDEAMMNRFNQLVAKGLYVTSLEQEQATKIGDRKVNLAFVMLPYAQIPDSAISVSESEMRAYYDTHKASFKAPETRSFAYVTLDVRPSQDDFDAAKEYLERNSKDFELAKNPAEFAGAYGDTPYAGQWYAEDQLPKEIADWAFAKEEVPVLSPIVLTDNTYEVARKIALRNLPDSVHARHILFSAQQRPPEEARKLADSVRALIASGSKFAALAEEFSDDPGSKAKGGDLGWFQQGMMVKPFNDACFLGKKGEVTIVESQFGLHIVEVIDQKGASPRVDLAIFARKVTAGKMTYQEVYNQAIRFAAQVHVPKLSWFKRIMGQETARLAQANNMFDTLSEAMNLRRMLASDVPELASRAGGLTNAREVVRWAYEAKPGDVSGVFELGEKFVVAMLEEVNESEDGYAAMSAVKDKLTEGVRLQKRQQMLREQIKEKMADANDISALAVNLGQNVKRANDVTFASYALGSEGFEPTPVGAGTVTPDGKLSYIADGQQGVFVLQAESSTIDPTTNPSAGKDLLAELRNRASFQAYPALQAMSDVVDRRAKFY